MATPRIVGGVVADPHAYPFVLSLRSWGYGICGAGLLNADWAITAAHCIEEGSSALQYSVAVHRHDLSIAESTDHHCSETVAAAQVIVHPSYDKQSMDGDLALIRLSESVRCISSIPTLVLDPGSAAPTGAHAVVAGCMPRRTRIMLRTGVPADERCVPCASARASPLSCTHAQNSSTLDFPSTRRQGAPQRTRVERQTNCITSSYRSSAIRNAPTHTAAPATPSPRTCCAPEACRVGLTVAKATAAVKI